MLYNKVNNTLVTSQELVEKAEYWVAKATDKRKRGDKIETLKQLIQQKNPFFSHVLHEYTAQEQRPNNILNNVNAPIFMSKQE